MYDRSEHSTILISSYPSIWRDGACQVLVPRVRASCEGERTLAGRSVSAAQSSHASAALAAGTCCPSAREYVISHAHCQEMNFTGFEPLHACAARAHSFCHCDEEKIHQHDRNACGTRWEQALSTLHWRTSPTGLNWMHSTRHMVNLVRKPSFTHVLACRSVHGQDEGETDEDNGDEEDEARTNLGCTKLE